MKIKTMIMSLGLVIALPLTATAGYDDKAEHVSKTLGLDKTRAGQVEEIFERYEDQHKLLKNQKKEQLEAVLSDDEYDRLEEMWDAKKKAKKECMSD